MLFAYNWNVKFKITLKYYLLKINHHQIDFLKWLINSNCTICCTIASLLSPSSQVHINLVSSLTWLMVNMINMIKWLIYFLTLNEYLLQPSLSFDKTGSSSLNWHLGAKFAQWITQRQCIDTTTEGLPCLVLLRRRDISAHFRCIC